MANNRLIIQPNSQSSVIQGAYDVFGTNDGAEMLTVYENTLAYLQGDFARGGDTLRLRDVAGDFTIRLAGSNAELVSTSDGIVASIPIGTVGLTIQFEATANGAFTDSRVLRFDGTNVVLGTQVLTGAEQTVNPLAAPAPAAANGPALPSFAAIAEAAPKAAAVSDAGEMNHFASFRGVAGIEGASVHFA